MDRELAEAEVVIAKIQEDYPDWVPHPRQTTSLGSWYCWFRHARSNVTIFWYPGDKEWIAYSEGGKRASRKSFEGAVGFLVHCLLEEK